MKTENLNGQPMRMIQMHGAIKPTKIGQFGQGGSFVCRDKNGIAYRPLDPDSTEDVENYSWGNDAFANAWMIELYASDPYDGNSYLRFLIKNNQNFINTSSWDEITYDKVFDSEQNTPFNVSVVSFDKNTHPAELENSWLLSTDGTKLEYFGVDATSLECRKQ